MMALTMRLNKSTFPWALSPVQTQLVGRVQKASSVVTDIALEALTGCEQILGPPR